METKKLPNYRDIKPLLNYTIIGEAIFNPGRDGKIPTYSVDDFDDIMAMIEAAAEKWLPRDILDLEINSIEEKKTYEINSTEIIKAYIDIEGTLRGYVAPFNEFKGQKIIIDWKTREGELDTRWRSRLIDSWQWRIYCAMLGAPIFNYRGITRRRDETGRCGTREIILAAPSSLREEVNEHCSSLIQLQDTLINNNVNVWPRNMPDACRTGTEWECPFKPDCDDYSMPRFVPEKKVMSYTEFHRFLTCPELSRRMRMEPEADETAASNIGSGFHSGIAELYAQAKQITL